MNLADPHVRDQAQSLLFSRIPGEIRNRIFSLALAQYEDKSKPYPEDAYYYRPKYRYEPRVDTALLRTCKKIYIESKHLPAESAILTMWFESDRRPPAHTNEIYRRKFTSHAGVKAVQLFAQMYWLENGGLNRWLRPGPPGERQASNFRPSDIATFEDGNGVDAELHNLQDLTVTIRHTDWWWWEQNEPLRIQSRWLEQGFVAPRTLQVFRLEMEVAMRKKNELDTIVTSLVRDWTFKRADEVVFSAKEAPLHIATWSGTALFDGINREPEDEIELPNGDFDYTQPETIDYYIVTVTWKPVITP